MDLGLAHSLSKYKLKFSPDKIDMMIVQVRKYMVWLKSSNYKRLFYQRATCTQILF